MASSSHFTRLAWLGVLVALLAVSKRVLFDPLVGLPFAVPKTAGSAILITGTSSGLGRHAAFHLAEMGFVVLATVRKEADGASLESEWETRKDGRQGNIVPLVMDVSSDESVESATERVKTFLKETDAQLVGIVNNAGVDRHGLLLDDGASVESYKFNFNVNVFGPVRVTRALKPLLLENGGRVSIHFSFDSFAPDAEAFFILDREYRVGCRRIGRQQRFAILGHQARTRSDVRLVETRACSLWDRGLPRAARFHCFKNVPKRCMRRRRASLL